MDLKTFITKRDGKATRSSLELDRIAKACGVSPEFLYLVVLGHKPASPLLAVNIEYATGGKVRRAETLPSFPWRAPVKAEAA